MRRFRTWAFNPLIAGLFLGIGGRLVMALIAVSEGVRQPPSLGGSLEVVATGVLIGTPAGMLYYLVRGRIRTAGWWTGMAWGGLYVTLLALVPPPAARSAVEGIGPHIVPLTLILFGALFVLYGILLEALVLTRRGAGRAPGGTV